MIVGPCFDELLRVASDNDCGDPLFRVDAPCFVDMDDLARSIDYADLAGRLDLAAVAKQVAEQSESPAPEAGLSDPSLVERLLDRAVTKLLQMAEEAAANEEV